LSALTKLFVVLLIICSLLLAAGVVVFVNNTQHYRTTGEAAQGRIDLLTTQLTAANFDANNARALATKSAEDALTLAGKLREEINTHKKAADDRAAEIAKNEAQIAVLSATLNEANAALKVAGTNLASLQTQYNALIKDNDKTRVENAELVGANTDLQKRVEEAQRELDYQLERVQQLTSELGNARQLLSENRIATNATPRRPASPGRIDGLIKGIKEIEGVRYGTINLGSADKIQRGTELNIIDRASNTYLGKITIETVDQNESFGRIEGRQAAQIREGHNVVSEI
jgi:DNA repair exonuclease SbcCD ATPase subunit